MTTPSPKPQTMPAARPDDRIPVACPKCSKTLRVPTHLRGRRVKCPQCCSPIALPRVEAQDDLEVTEVIEEAPSTPPTRRWAFVAATILIALFCYGCAYYAALSPDIRSEAHNGHLGAEYLHIAKSLLAGDGYASPFGGETGPTAWMPPVLPTILAGILWLADGDLDTLQTVIVTLQIHVLIFTGMLVVALARLVSVRRGIVSFVAAVIYCFVLLSQYRLCFTVTHDSWIVMLAVDMLVTGLCFFQPMRSKTSAAVWGALGGTFSLINPIVGFAWGIVSIGSAIRERQWKPLAIAIGIAILVHAPWTVRNWLLFGRIIPIKSNLAYELYQSQCLQREGLLQAKTFRTHPYPSPNRARAAYKEMGEIAFLDEKRELFWNSVCEDPLDFCERVATRFVGTLLWYETFEIGYERIYPWVTWINKILHPLPFVALVILAYSAFWRPLHPAQWSVMAVFMLYQMPYVAISYYERYALPVIGLKAVLMVWLLDRAVDLALGSRRART